MARPFSLRQASTRWWVVLVALVTAFALLYFRHESAPSEPARLEGPTMGTRWSVLLDGPRDPERRAALQAAIEALLVDVNRSMSTWDPESELSRFNRREDTTPVEISAPLASVVALSLEVHRDSGGVFDVTVGPLVDAWGFGPGKRPASPLTEEALSALLARVGSDKLRLEGTQLAKDHPRLQIDLSAVAKGDAVDRVSELLVAEGEPNHLVEIGGEMRARGRNARGEPFRVGIEEPDPAGQQVRLAVLLDDRALASSGNYRNFFEVDGQRFAHTLDPRTGRPVRHPLQAVSVLHERCGVADAWATALMVAGPDEAWRLAELHGLDVLLLVEKDGEITERATPGFEAALLPRTQGGR